MQQIRFHYRRALESFIALGLAPVPEVIQDGALPIEEAVPVLIDLHAACRKRVRNALPGFTGKERRLGPEAVSEVLIADLSEFYGLPEEQIHLGLLLKEERKLVIDEELQPRLDTGRIDHLRLIEECDLELDRRGWTEEALIVDAFATPEDPRRLQVLSRVSLRAEGVAWVSRYRPHLFRAVRFDEIRLVTIAGDREVTFDLLDWRRRQVTDLEVTEPWQEFLEELRLRSEVTGIDWKRPSEGRRAG